MVTFRCMCYIWVTIISDGRFIFGQNFTTVQIFPVFLFMSNFQCSKISFSSRIIQG